MFGDMLSNSLTLDDHDYLIDYHFDVELRTVSKRDSHKALRKLKALTKIAQGSPARYDHDRWCCGSCGICQ